MADQRNVTTNLDDVIQSVDICIGIAKETQRQYKYLSLLLENGEELKWFPEDRMTLRVLEQEVELKALRPTK